MQVSNRHKLFNTCERSLVGRLLNIKGHQLSPGWMLQQFLGAQRENCWQTQGSRYTHLDAATSGLESFTFFQLYGDITGVRHHASLRCTMYWFYVCVYHLMIATARFVNTPVASHSCNIFALLRTFKIDSWQLSSIEHSTVNSSHGAVYYIPRIYSSFFFCSC